MEVNTESESNQLEKLLSANPDDIRLAKETARGIGITLIEFAIRQAMDGNYNQTNAALAAVGEIPDSFKLSFLATAYEKAAENIERTAFDDKFKITEGLRLRQISDTFRKKAQETEKKLM